MIAVVVGAHNVLNVRKNNMDVVIVAVRHYHIIIICEIIRERDQTGFPCSAN